MKKIAVILSGCGVFDGSEIHEATCTLLALEQAGATYQCFAPNVNQSDVINHLTQEKMNETRNVLIEAARIARGNIKDIKEAKSAEFDAAIYPGGFGTAKNLSNFATNGTNMVINPDVLAFAQSMKDNNKPQGFLCISPVLISSIYGPGILQTIGNDKGTASAIEQMGGKHIACPVEKTVIDPENKVISTPAYMLAKNIHEVYQGVSRLVEDVLRLV